MVTFHGSRVGGKHVLFKTDMEPGGMRALRASRYKGLRIDKDARAVTRET